ncbi:MAG: MBL fold metallo-hydrolase [Microgenomates group bacterium]
MRKVLFWSVVLTFLLLAWVVGQMPDGKLHLIFCDVGQGDAGLIIKGDFQMLIDTGPKNGGVLACLSSHVPFWDHQIEVLVNSHPQADHIGALAEVEGRYRIGKKWLTGVTGDRIRYGSLSFDVLWPTAGGRVLGASTDLNQLSVVVEINYGKFRALFTGDLGEEEELALEETGVLKRLDVLKVAHHGSKYSSAAEFLSAVRPKLAVISVGRNNYGHPTSEALERLKAVGSRIWRTDKQGELEIVTDGRSLWSSNSPNLTY